MKMIVMASGRFDKWNAGVVEENELNRSECTEQTNQLGRCALVIMTITHRFCEQKKGG